MTWNWLATRLVALRLLDADRNFSYFWRWFSVLTGIYFAGHAYLWELRHRKAFVLMYCLLAGFYFFAAAKSHKTLKRLRGGSA